MLKIGTAVRFKRDPNNPTPETKAKIVTVNPDGKTGYIEVEYTDPRNSREAKRRVYFHESEIEEVKEKIEITREVKEVKETEVKKPIKDAKPLR